MNITYEIDELPETLRARWNRERRERMMAAGPRVPYDRQEIFARDNWLCQICMLFVDRTLRAPHPGTASIDHINGLRDTPNNVRLAHLFCNSDSQIRVRPVVEAQIRFWIRVTCGNEWQEFIPTQK